MHVHGRVGKDFPAYPLTRTSSIVRANDTSIPVHGVRTIYVKILPYRDDAVGITFTVCDVQELIVSFSQMMKKGYEVSL